MSKGMFVVFEGPDGCGKTSVSKAVYALLRDRDGIQGIVTNEPTRIGPFGKAVRERLEGAPADDLTMLFGMLADRAWHLDQVINPTLADGELVICDRYILSTLIYQGQHFNLNWLKVLCRDFLVPDLQVLINVPVETCWERMTGTGRGGDRYEGRILEKVVAQYREIARGIVSGDPHHEWRIAPWASCVVVDGTRPFDEVVEAAYQMVLAAWKKHQEG